MPRDLVAEYLTKRNADAAGEPNVLIPQQGQGTKRPDPTGNVVDDYLALRWPDQLTVERS